MKSLHIGELTIPIPVVQGGMGIGVSLSGLAAAVANMGGVGVIASVGLSLIHGKDDVSFRQNNINGLRTEIKTARKKTNGILGVNIMAVLTNFSDLVKTAIEEKIDIIFSGAGLPLDLPKYLNKDSKTKLVPIISSGRAASILCNKWKNNFDYLPDALVLEGPKAGGHLGFKLKDIHKENHKLENLLPEILEVTTEIKEKYGKEIPVIAAGGIYTGEDIFKIMKLGAAGVQMGTRFIATQECDAPKEFKDAFINATEDDIKIIQSPVGLPGRTIMTLFVDEAYAGKRRPKSCKFACIRSCNPKTTLYCIADALMAAYLGNMNDGFAFSGANGFKITKITDVPTVFAELKQEYDAAKQNAD